MDINARFLNEAREIEAQWARTGLLEGIQDRFVRSTTAVLLENQRLINEVSTDTSDIAQFKRISIPLVRRIYPQLIANKIVSVQPLLGPTGLVYYLRFRYSSNKGQIRGASNNGGYPGDDVNTLMQRASGDGNLDIFYTSQFVQNRVQWRSRRSDLRHLGERTVHLLDHRSPDRLRDCRSLELDHR
jgi:hypothetical protein